MPIAYYDPMGLVSVFGDSPLGEFGNGAADGALQACDAFNPFADPFSPYYNPSDPGMRAGKKTAELADFVMPGPKKAPRY